MGTSQLSTRDCKNIWKNIYNIIWLCTLWWDPFYLANEKRQLRLLVKKITKNTKKTYFLCATLAVSLLLCQVCEAVWWKYVDSPQSKVTCDVSHVWKIGWTSRWRVCYQRVLPRQVFLSQGNLRKIRDLFLFLLILRQKSAKNNLSPKTCYTASLGGIWKRIDKCKQRNK